jgi:hypothetical protein
MTQAPLPRWHRACGNRVILAGTSRPGAGGKQQPGWKARRRRGAQMTLARWGFPLEPWQTACWIRKLLPSSCTRGRWRRRRRGHKADIGAYQGPAACQPWLKGSQNVLEAPRAVLQLWAASRSPAELKNQADGDVLSRVGRGLWWWWLGGSGGKNG